MSLSIGLKIPSLDPTPEAFRELGGWCADWWDDRGVPDSYYEHPERGHITGLYEWLGEPQPEITDALWEAFVAGWKAQREKGAT